MSAKDASLSSKKQRKKRAKNTLAPPHYFIFSLSWNFEFVFKILGTHLPRCFGKDKDEKWVCEYLTVISTHICKRFTHIFLPH